ncbi:alpha/beta fold hydrolase [Hyphomonas sp.]|uniref:alpha/beta fold hydrolase n=1 Tax=Hyphomonas sp. TaxID=87 RepID=UPI00391B4E37
MALPTANRLDQIGDKKRLLRYWQTAHLEATGTDLEYMQFGADDLRPLIFLTSIEYPAAPPWGFCIDAANEGFGVYSIRRPGFGVSTPAPSLSDQARALAAFLEEAGLQDVVIVSTGSANPVAVRLALQSKRVAFFVFANCVFNRDVMGEFRPAWFGKLLSQTLESRAGARVSLGAIRQAGRQFGSSWFFQTCFQKSPGDVAFVKSHPREMAEAWEVSSVITPETYVQEIEPSLRGDTFLTDGLLKDLPALAVSGVETTDTWKAGFEQEAARLGIETAYLASGDVLAVYQSGMELLNLIRKRLPSNEA